MPFIRFGSSGSSPIWPNTFHPLQLSLVFCRQFSWFILSIFPAGLALKIWPIWSIGEIALKKMGAQQMHGKYFGKIIVIIPHF
jgi:hypothetical protein